MDTLKFHIVTWNVATKSPRQDLNSLLDFPSQFNKNKVLPDFYVIGLQEVKSQPQNMLMDSLFTDPWTAAFNKVLCRQGYIIAKSTRLQGIIILVYARMKHLTHLRDIESQYTKTGLGGLWGNKGAVSVRFNIYGCSVCLVNSHLTAHEHLLEDRINDYNTIIKQHDYHVRETINILYHDYVFWLGDLNFRTDHPAGSSPSSEEIVDALKAVEKDKYERILQHDQLLAVMDAGEAFSEFCEGDINFPPTYKFVIGTDEYDIKRKPSWTDRILYKVIPDNYENIKLRADLLLYNHLPHYTVSDHKPVVAQFNIKIRNGPARSSGAAPRAVRSAIRMRSAMIAPVAHGTVDQVDPGDPNAVAEAEIASEAQETDQFEDEAFANHAEQMVEFAPITRVWYIGDADFRTQCTLSPDVEAHPSDWIGIYDANFESLEDYIAYEYLAKLSLSETPLESGQPRKITLSFPVGSGVRTPGFYRFIYFSQPNGDVRSVLGISEPFEVSTPADELAHLGLSLPDQPCSSSSSPGGSNLGPTSDIFTDFTGLDVAKLSRHFSNDLSID